MAIKNKEFREAMKRAGLNTVQLEYEKEGKYFYIWSTDSEEEFCIYLTELKITEFEQLSIEEWIEVIKQALKVEGIE